MRRKKLKKNYRTRTQWLFTNLLFEAVVLAEDLVHEVLVWHNGSTAAGRPIPVLGSLKSSNAAVVSQLKLHGREDITLRSEFLLHVLPQKSFIRKSSKRPDFGASEINLKYLANGTLFNKLFSNKQYYLRNKLSIVRISGR